MDDFVQMRARLQQAMDDIGISADTALTMIDSIKCCHSCSYFEPLSSGGYIATSIGKCAVFERTTESCTSRCDFWKLRNYKPVED